MQEIIVIFYSYLLGSIPFGLILTKVFKKQDIRSIGSKNIGATNVFRSSSKILGILTLLLDILKAFSAVFITQKFFLDITYLSALVVFLGHLYPVWLKFKGGKGVAVYLGILLGVNISLALVFIIIWISLILITKYASLASIISSLGVLIMNIFFYSLNESILYFLFLILLIYSHKSNIVRLKAGNENKINL